jgi:hypothetical protein
MQGYDPMIRLPHPRASLALAASLGLTLAIGREVPAATPLASQPTTLLTSIKSIDVHDHKAVFPVHRGFANGRTVWYILTDASDASAAKRQGLIFSPAIANVGTTQNVTLEDGAWHFSGAPDFSKARVFRPGPTGFPPSQAAPGAQAEGPYTPFVRLAGSPVVYNAPIVAVGDGPFDVVRHSNTAQRVLALDPSAKTVTLLLANGFADGKRVLYISTEASDPGAATIERATYVPGLAHSSAAARLPIYVIANGQTGSANAHAQGLAFVALDGGLSEEATAANSAQLQSSRNILGSAPSVGASGNGIYTPLWDVYVGAWSAAATTAHRNTQLTSAAAVTAAVAAHDLTGPGGKAFGPVGFAVNCPVVAIFGR